MCFFLIYLKYNKYTKWWPMFFHKRFEKPSDNELGAWEEPIPKKDQRQKISLD
jgi:hypothetical protein